MTFDEWWYDYHVKNGITNTPKHTDLAKAVWNAALDEAEHIVDNLTRSQLDDVGPAYFVRQQRAV